MPAHGNTRDLAPRVSVLETSVEGLKAETTALRGESREGFANLRSAVERLGERMIATEAGRPRATNWYAVAGFVVAAVTITGAIFSLAEWRVATAFDPLKEIVREHRHELRDARDKQLQLRIELEREKAIRDAQSKVRGDAR